MPPRPAPVRPYRLLLVLALAISPPGDLIVSLTIEVVIVRDGEEEGVLVTLSELPDGDDTP